MATITGCGPDHLQEVANVPGIEVWDLHAEGDLLYAAAGNRGLVIFDISEPEQPREIGALVPGDQARGFGVAVAGQYAYLGAMYALFAIDVSDPSQPVEVGQVAGRTTNFVVQGDYLYRIVSDLEVIDVSVPSALQPVGELALDAFSGSVAVSGDMAVVGDNQNAIHIIDVSNPVQPTLTATFEAERVGAVAIEGDLVYGAGADEFVIVDVADPSRPRLRGCHASTCPNAITSLFVEGDYAYVAGEDCLEVYDVSDSESPNLAATLEAIVPIPYWDVVVSHGYIFLAHLGGLRIFPQAS